MARSGNRLGLLLALVLTGCGRDEHAGSAKAAILQKPYVDLKDEETTLRSLHEIADSGGTRENKNQIMLGMERMAAQAAAEEDYLARLRAQKGATQSQPLFSILTITQMLQQDMRVRAAFDGKTADDFLKTARGRR